MTQKIEIQEIERYARYIERMNLKRYGHSQTYTAIMRECAILCIDHESRWVEVEEDWKTKLEKHLIRDSQLLF